MGPVDSDARIAWGAAARKIVLILAKNSVSFIAFPAPIYSTLTAVRLSQVASCAIWMLVLLREWPKPHLGVSLAAFGLSPLLQLVQVSVFAVARESGGLSFEPLVRQKLMVLLIAIFTPRQVWVAVLLIAAFAVEACLEFWIPGLGASENFGPWEPWITLSTAALAIWLAYSRAQLLSRERTLRLQLREATEALRLAKMALAVRDLANTPLQVIELQAALLEERDKYAPEIAPIRRALNRLSKLSKILETYEPPGWNHEDDSLVAFDAEALLRQLGRESRH
jgi:hypothetical protein